MKRILTVFLMIVGLAVVLYIVITSAITCVVVVGVAIVFAFAVDAFFLLLWRSSASHSSSASY